MKYGDLPEFMGVFELPEFEEYMHYLYLPVRLAAHEDIVLPKRLEFVRELLRGIKWEDWSYRYVYVTARRGWAAPGANINRPGWHCDGFGSDDINYVWSDAFGTRFAEQEFANISTDHVESLRQFEEQVDLANVITYPDGSLLRLTPKVVHATSEVPAPGGSRSFVKLSFSNHRYNLKGNSHNHLLDYNWEMFDRSLLRNDPAYAGKDFYGGEA